MPPRLSAVALEATPAAPQPMSRAGLARSRRRLNHGYFGSKSLDSSVAPVRVDIGRRRRLRGSHPAAIVGRRQRNRARDGAEVEIGIADQVVDHPAAAVTTPVLHPALLAGDQEK